MIKITNISQFDELLKSKEEIKLKIEEVDGIKVGIICYMIELPDTFDSELAKECRGITFRMDTGECISRPFHKFFNVNQKEETLVQNIDWESIRYMTPKHDGSLAIPVLVNNKVFWKSKKSFYSDVAKNMQQIYETWDQKIKDFLIHLLYEGYTPLYEYVSPNNRIVLEYEKEDLILLCLRNIETGEYTGFSTAYMFEVASPEVIEKPKTLQDLIDWVVKRENEEGYVISNFDGSTVLKLKTPWYLSRHHAVSAISMKELIKLILDEKIDDVISTLREMKMDRQIEVMDDIIREVNLMLLNYIEDSKRCLQYFSESEVERKEWSEYIKNCHFLKDKLPIVYAIDSNKDYVKIAKDIVYKKLVEKYKGKIFAQGVIE